MLLSSMKLILLLLLIRFIVCRQYHILPSSCGQYLQESCVTLTHFTTNASKHLDSLNTTLILDPGNHSLDSLLSVSNVTNFAILPKYMSKTVHSGVIITCSVTGRLYFTNVSKVRIVGVHFVGCVSNKISLVESFFVEGSSFLGHEAVSGRLLQIVQSKGTVMRCLFTKMINSTNEDNGALRSTTSDIVVMKCVFSDINSTNGALFCEENSTVDILKSSFYIKVYGSHQRKLSVGTLYITTHCRVIIQECLFQGNKIFSINYYSIAAHNGSSVIISGSKFRNISNCGVVSAVNTQMLTVNNSVFIANDGYPNEMNDSLCERVDGNAMNSQVIAEGTAVNIRHCQFTANTRGVLAVSRSVIDVSMSQFINNTKFTKGTVLWAEHSITNISECEFRNNEATNTGGAVELHQCRATIRNSVFLNNRADLGGGLAFFGIAIIISGSNFSNNFADSMGGAIYAEAETTHGEISFQDTCILSNNYAGVDYGSGGGLHLTTGGGNSFKALVQGKIIIANNTVYQGNGGGVFLYLVKLTIQGNGSLELIHNYAGISGGGIYAEGSWINVNRPLDPKRTFISFFKNHATYGGGLYLCKSVLYISMSTCDSTFHHSVKFISNSANIGGATYLYEICDLFEDMIDQCFFHILPIGNCTRGRFKDLSKHSIHFTQNCAEISGSSIYKESFGHCTLGHLRVQELTNLLEVSDISVSDIGSLAVQVCLCHNGQPDCDYQIHSVIKVMNGKEFTIEVAIADRGNHVVNGSINARIQDGLIREDQRKQDVTGGCTLLKFNIFSTQGYQQLTMVPVVKSPYINTNLSITMITIEFPFCISCPVGFQKIVDEVTGCHCNCDKDLKPFITDCDPLTGVITKGQTSAWISYINTTKGTSGYLVYPYCPYDYCLPHALDETVNINLNVPKGADTQCAHNRSGTLCGTCSEGLSLSLGSSHCIHCPSNWHSLLSAILFSELLAGIILVIFLMSLNLTVAVGTLNGIIFYANIVGANISVFFPSTSIFTVFISWINLELGIDTCLFEGMDAYWKVWIELAFPMYIIILVVVVIITSERFVIVARLIGKKNPVATLDTLILLSYMKFLHIIIASYSFAILDYPDNSYQILWLPDATVHYFSGKHIVLSIIATVILTAGIAYTALLFFWQWLLLHQRRRIFRWVQHQRLCLFLEPYHAPYNFKHRYWTGLLLLVRVILYIIFSVNVSGDPGVNILATGVLVSSLLLLKGLLRSNSAIYKKWPVEVLEVVSYVNIAWLCLARYYTMETGRGQWIVSYVSGGITFTLCLIVLAYHAINEFFVKTNLYQKVKRLLMRKRYKIVNNRDDATIALLASDGNVTEGTISEVNLPTHTELRLSELIQDSEKAKKDDTPSDIDYESKKQSEDDIVSHHKNTST